MRTPKMTLSVVLPLALLALAPPASAFDADRDGDGIPTVLDYVYAKQQLLGVLPQDPAADLDGDGIITALDVVMHKHVILEIRPTLFATTVVAAAGASGLSLGEGVGLGQISSVRLDGAPVPWDGAGIDLPCTPTAVQGGQYEIETFYTLPGQPPLPGSRLTVQVPPGEVAPECAAALGPCVDPATGCDNPACHTGACVQQGAGWACELAPGVEVCEACPEGTVPDWDGTCQPAGALGGGNPSLYWPVADASDGTRCTTYKNHVHNACDIPVVTGTPVAAPLSGNVVELGRGCPDNTTALEGAWSPVGDCNGGAGNYVKIKADDGRLCELMHLQAGSFPDLVVGEHLCAGEGFARTGASGRVYSSWGGDGGHLHLACLIDGVWTWPDDLWIDRQTYKLGSACPEDPVCGNGVQETGEACDEGVDNGAGCPAAPGVDDVVGCTTSCTLDTTSCCAANDHLGCYADAVYWFSSCGQRGSLAAWCQSVPECKVGGCSGSSCVVSDAPNGTPCSGGTCQSGQCQASCGSNLCADSGRTSGYVCDGSTRVGCGTSGGCAVETSRTSCSYGCAAGACQPAPACGGEGEACCGGSSCDGALSCSGGVCTCSATASATCYGGDLYYRDCNGSISYMKQDCACGCTGSSCSACGPTSVTIDNDTTGFTRYDGIYWWKLDNPSFDANAWNNNLRYTFGEEAGGGTYWGRWRTSELLTGTYRVWVYRPDPGPFDPNPQGWPDTYVDCTQVEYTVVHDGSPSGQLVTKSQAGSEGWMLLGTFTFTGRYGQVTLTDRAWPSGCAVAYDAARWELL